MATSRSRVAFSPWQDAEGVGRWVMDSDILPSMGIERPAEDHIFAQISPLGPITLTGEDPCHQQKPSCSQSLLNFSHCKC